ncbi:MAG: TIGR02281 family clan AA aspartic protease [Phycisphaeraceae bacterium]
MQRLSPFCVLLLLTVALAPAQRLAADPAKTLEDAGLTRAGLEYVIAEEEEIIKARREIKDAQRDLDKAEDQFRDAERKIAKAQHYIANLQREMSEAKYKANSANTRQEQARAIKAYDDLVALIKQVQVERTEFEKDQQVKIDDARAAYIATMVTWVEKAQVVTDKYAELAEDAAITGAIEAISDADKRKYVLGPSRRFEIINRDLAKAAAEYQRGAVDLRKVGNVMEIDVRINGKPIRSMILDTGASALSLPHLFATDLGITVTDADPIVQLQMADGKLVDARRVTLESVQVGEFICNGVEAFVLPPDLSAASPLLGNSFLSNFTYEIDPDRGKLILSRLNPDEQAAK